MSGGLREWPSTCGRCRTRPRACAASSRKAARAALPRSSGSPRAGAARSKAFYFAFGDDDVYRHRGPAEQRRGVGDQPRGRRIRRRQHQDRRPALGRGGRRGHEDQRRVPSARRLTRRGMARRPIASARPRPADRVARLDAGHPLERAEMLEVVVVGKPEEAVDVEDPVGRVRPRARPAGLVQRRDPAERGVSSTLRTSRARLPACRCPDRRRCRARPSSSGGLPGSRGHRAGPGRPRSRPRPGGGRPGAPTIRRAAASPARSAARAAVSIRSLSRREPGEQLGPAERRAGTHDSSHAEALEVAQPPALGRFDRIERVDVEPGDPRSLVRDQRGQALEQAIRPVEPARPDEPRHEPTVLRQESVGVGDADPGADREQSLRLGHAGQADVDGQPDPLRPPGGQPGGDRRRVEAELGRHVRRERRLGMEGLEQRLIRDERMALRVAGDPDLVELGDRPRRAPRSSESPSGKSPCSFASPPTMNARFTPAPASLAMTSSKVGPIPDHPSRQVGDRAEPRGLELLGTAPRSPRSCARAKR